MCVTLIRLPFENDNCDQYHLILQPIFDFFLNVFDYAVLAYSYCFKKNQRLHCLAHLIKIIDFAGLTTRSEHLLKAVTYVTWHNK